MHTPVVSHVPRGVGCPPPPGMDPRRGKGKLMCIKVRMLDDSVAVFHLGEVIRHLNILESDYFGLEYIDGYGNKCWLDRDKSILRQITSTQSDARFYFVVKFYTPEPASLEEEYTRYLFALQIRRDLARGELICNENTAALLVSFIVQSECGDFSSADYPHHTYLSATDFIPNQTAAFQMAVMENHRKLMGMSPADADLALLETARRCEFYGIKLSAAKDIEGTDVSLSVAHMGIKVFHQLNCVSTFSWAKIRKLSFKRRKLMVKLHPESYYYKEVIEFVFENRDECKNFWKKSVEHHAFFRCAEPVDPRRKKDSKLFSRGSSFHYYGRTQKQLIDYVREHRKRREPFQRPIRANSTSRHHLRSIQFNVARDGDPTQMPLQLSVADRRYASNNGRCAAGRRLSSTNVPQEGLYGLPNGNGEEGGSHRNGRRPVGQAFRPKSAYQPDASAYRQSYQERMCASDMESSMHMPLPLPSKLQQRNNGRDRSSVEREPSAPPAGDYDPMTMSLPNVLADPRFAPSHLLSNAAAPYHTSRAVSGDNMAAASHIEGDVSEGGTYRIGRDGEAASCDSSQSDVGSSMSTSVGSKATATPDPRIYSTNFTTRRVGNVIVKRVMPQSSRTTSTTAAGEWEGNYVNGDQVGQQQQQQQQLQDLATATTEAEPYYYTCYRGREETSSSVSAPSSATNRYLPVSSNFQPHHNQRHHTSGRLRTAVPVPIDGPLAQTIGVPSSTRSNYDNVSNTSGISSTSVETKTANIIRPVVLASSNGGTSNSVGTGSVSTILRRPVLVKPTTSTTTPSASSSLSSSLFRNAMGTSGAETSVAITASSSQVSSTSLVGTIISNESSEAVELDIKVDGGTLKREECTSRSEGAGGRGERPKVPPKPQNITSIVAAQVNIDEMNVVVSPLDSILHDARELSDLFGAAHSQENEPSHAVATTSSALHPPSSISIESEEVPDVKTMHLFSDEPTIPYTLTIRNINSAIPIPPGASAPTARNGTEYEGTLLNQPYRHSLLRATTSGDSNFQSARTHPNRKSLDLVHRKQLPHHDNFSAEDHSISPTSPESGNVVEYVARRRSLSTDRYPAASSSFKPDAGKLRGTSRRLTQPIQTSSIGVEHRLSADSKVGFDGQDPEAEKDLNDCPLPDPPPTTALAGAAAGNSSVAHECSVGSGAVKNEGKESTPKDTSEEGVLLETDF